MLGSVVFAETASRYKASDNSFSFVPPEGWQEKDWPGMKYKVFLTQPAEKFAPNITIVDEVANMSIKDYVDANRKALSASSKDYKELSLDPFTTDGGLKGYRLSFKNRQMEMDLIQTQYYFSGSEKKLVITCSVAEKDTRPIAAQCDKSLKTFQFGAGGSAPASK
jgi:hypothetical protein